MRLIFGSLVVYSPDRTLAPSCTRTIETNQAAFIVDNSKMSERLYLARVLLTTAKH